MKNKISLIALFAIVTTIVLLGCKKTTYSFGNIKAPSNLAINAVVIGATSSDSAGDGSGKVLISMNATDAITYKVYFGNGDSALVPSGDTTFTYTAVGINTYIINAVAIGTGGAMTNITKSVTVAYNFVIPATIIADLTNGGTKVWMIDSNSVGNFGVGPLTDFTPDYYNANANEEPAGAYGSVITFTSAGDNSITMNDNNNGLTFIINAATQFYGFGSNSGDNVYPLNTGGTKTLSFGNATSGSTSSNSTQIQFTVPGNGIVGFGTGAVQYEILSMDSTSMYLRNVGIDGNAWYQKLKAK